MHGSGQLYTNLGHSQRRRIDTHNTQNILEQDTNGKNKQTKEEKRRVQMTTLTNKYFNKISNAVIKANAEDKKSIHFFIITIMIL